MRQRLASLLFQDSDPTAARAQRNTPVEVSKVSPSARRKTASKTKVEGFPVQSFSTLMTDLAIVALNRASLLTQDQAAITIVTKPTPLQRKALDRLSVHPQQNVSIQKPAREMCYQGGRPRNGTSYASNGARRC